MTLQARIQQLKAHIPDWLKMREPRTPRGRTLKRQLERIVPALIVVVLVAGLGEHLLFPGHADTVAPTSPPVQLCGGSSTLNGPGTAPAGAVTVPAGNNSSQLGSLNPNTTYYFASGTHILGTGQFDQINPENNDTFIGAPGAIIDGQNKNNFAFVGNDTSVTGVTIEYLTIQNFSTPGAQGAVNTNSNDNWTIRYDTIKDIVPGAAMMLGSDNVVTNNCLTHNGEYAFNGYQDPSDPKSSSLTTGPQNINVSDNEISYNNTCNWDSLANFPITVPAGCAGAGQFDGCGCDGGGKFWAVDQATFDSNYVHDNYSVGMWADTNNTGFDVEGNFFANNLDAAIIYEISYNALIKNNTFIGNANTAGPQNPGFPTPAVYISESGGDARIPGFSNGSLDITGNVFTDNFSGVALWENADRYCSSSANSSTGDCTLVNKSVANITTCANATDLAKTPYINDCRWKTQNVSVDHNTFNFNPTAIGSKCTTANVCGFNALFSQYGSYPPYTGFKVPNSISNDQNNVFSNNIYNGPWQFMGFSQSDEVGWSQWSSGFNDNNGSGDHFNAQDVNSTFNGNTTPTPSTPQDVTATATGPTSVTVSWSASTDAGGPGLGGYRILRGGIQVGSVGASTTTYNDTAVSANTQYNYIVEAYDTDTPSNVSAQSVAATTTTPASGQNPGLSLSITNNSSIHGAAQTLTATVTPAAGNTIAQTSFFLDGSSTALQTITTAPYIFSLNTLGLADGNHTLTIKATDNHGSVGTQSIAVVISNGDFNGDGKISISDLAIMASNWNKQSGASYGQGDINGDGKVTISDLSTLATNWNKSW